MKKFTQMPIGLGLWHMENENCAAIIWNRLIDEGKEVNSLWEATPTMLHNITYRLRSGTMISLGIVEKVGDKYRLSDDTIQKCKKYLKID